MGFRFRKSFKIIPGVRVNLSKSGTSWSFGGRGATVNVKGRRIRGTVGIPGTGLSYSEQVTAPEEHPQQLMQRPASTRASRIIAWVSVLAIVGIFALQLMHK